MSECAHIAAVPRNGGILGAAATSQGCAPCLAVGSPWVTLRRCLECGAIGCCDSSPNRHASRHALDAGHPLVQSFEPGQDWIWCFLDETALELPEAAASPSHP
jgi:uncharacterized UBP type Zn finger protein